MVAGAAVHPKLAGKGFYCLWDHGVFSASLDALRLWAGDTLPATGMLYKSVMVPGWRAARDWWWRVFIIMPGGRNAPPENHGLGGRESLVAVLLLCGGAGAGSCSPAATCAHAWVFPALGPAVRPGERGWCHGREAYIKSYVSPLQVTHGDKLQSPPGARVMRAAPRPKQKLNSSLIVARKLTSRARSVRTPPIVPKRQTRSVSTRVLRPRAGRPTGRMLPDWGHTVKPLTNRVHTVVFPPLRRRHPPGKGAAHTAAVDSHLPLLPQKTPVTEEPEEVRPGTPLRDEHVDDPARPLPTSPAVEGTPEPTGPGKKWTSPTPSSRQNLPGNRISTSIGITGAEPHPGYVRAT